MEIGTVTMTSPVEPGIKKSFPDLVYDTILIEKATNCRSELSVQATRTYASITLKELSDAFRIAQAVCRDYHAENESHLQSAAMEAELAQAGLSNEINLMKYIDTIGYGSNGTVSHRHDIQQSHPTPSARQGSETGIMLPIPDAESMRRFQEQYGKAPAIQHDMMARIVFRLRQELWNQTVQPNHRDRAVANAIYQYGSRYCQQRGFNKPQPVVLSGLDRSKDHIARIEAHLIGLKIIDGVLHKKTYCLQGELQLPVVEPTSVAIENISASMMSLYQRLVPSTQCILARTQLMQKLQRILDAAYPRDNLRLKEFGSCASGLGSESSDADLCITTTTFQRTKPYNDMRSLASVLRRGGMINVQPIISARVPIVKFDDPTSRIKCDINTNHCLGIHNSELIRCYTMIDDRVRPLLYNLKALVKKHHINDSSQSWLSSYAYEPPILPSLQAQPKEFMTSLHITEMIEGRSGGGGGSMSFDCTFDRDYTRHRNFGAANKKSVGQLLIEFFEYYSRYFDYQTMEVNVRLGGGVRIRDEITLKLAKGGAKRAPQPGRGEKKLIIKDPFILDRNVSGTCIGRKLEKVWRIFEHIYLTLSKGEFEKAFEPIPEYYFRDLEEQYSEPAPRRSRMKKAERKLERKTETQRQSRPATALAPSTRTATQPKVSSVNGKAKALPETTVTTAATPLTVLSADKTSNDSEDADSASKRRRARRATAREFHNGLTQGSGADGASGASSSNVPNNSLKPKSEKKAVAKSQLNQSISQSTLQGSTTVTHASPSKTSSLHSKNQKKQLKQAFPVLEKTRKLLLQSKKPDPGVSGAAAASTTVSSNQESSSVRPKQVPTANPTVKQT
ncbi:hypothetical protein BGZ80_009003 [Entomortierella chlamydospora]|uniref:polynucleotide adenylyltransferase n=1 Tax=Entomortierella chlamydospora TaxID=101097 RepID=A0A9P6N4E4_9FUNG|nr:hypothetical protein BGZ79_001607 [Entomortierella chlamydospora]KAG0023570.1 hypothetical protein BGZ80_009003 [Entomortierella chlamydospora]